MTLAITAMGSIQQAVHHVYAGKPKAAGLDTFDRLLEYRDHRLKNEAKAANPKL
eukprot:CAMPEP_0197591732 /NCGR_PEP_ID=MMETSP1326-20131121/13883_1 /TAXON_ID=1155430 /ORGANISM="Genus nov. species nov., Strain RCC2288" /LENGTH=53 /DNA_ID=CAMNT_0043157281 /DNA_START=231 /DNA_END=392 /DNA_ORIENTATION=+